MVATARRCPQCGKPVSAADQPYRPFCSERCKLIDLSNWLGEQYRIPGEPLEDEAGKPDDEE